MKIKPFWFIFVGVAAAHLFIFWLIHDIPIFDYSKGAIAEQAKINFFHRIVPPQLDEEGNVVVPEQKEFTISTKLVPAFGDNHERVVPEAEKPEITLAPATQPISTKGAPQPSAPLPAKAKRVGESRLSFFDIKNSGRCVVYLIDASGSMWEKMEGQTKFEIATQEVKRSLRELAPDTQFNIIFFANKTVSFARHPQFASEVMKRRATQFLEKLPDLNGQTDLVGGIQEALEMEPDNVFLVTDGIANSPSWNVLAQVNYIQKKREARAQIFAVGLTNQIHAEGDKLLKTLTAQHGGEYFVVRSPRIYLAN